MAAVLQFEGGVGDMHACIIWMFIGGVWEIGRSSYFELHYLTWEWDQIKEYQLHRKCSLRALSAIQRRITRPVPSTAGDIHTARQESVMMEMFSP